jgi:hypothetical protein
MKMRTGQIDLRLVRSAIRIHAFHRHLLCDIKRMNPLKQRWTDDDLNTYALTTASAAAGCALGILFGRGMSRTSANIAALSLLATGALLAAPSLTEIVTRVANRPASARGSRKRLEGIRNGSVPAEGAEIYSVEEGL